MTKIYSYHYDAIIEHMEQYGTSECAPDYVECNRCPTVLCKKRK